MSELTYSWISDLINPLPIGLLALLLVVINTAPGWQRKLGVFASTMLLLFSLPFFSQYLVYSLESRYGFTSLDDLPRSDHVFMMGGALKVPQGLWTNPELSSESHRLHVVSEIFKKRIATQVSILGGNKSDISSLKSEAYHAKDILIKWGIPGEKITIFPGSLNTEQDVIIMLEELELGGDATNEKVLLVTSAFHIPRVMSLLCSSFEERVSMVPATHYSVGKPELLSARWIPGAGHLKNSSIAIREYVRIVSYALGGKTGWSALWRIGC